MRLGGRRRSSNVEDRRGSRARAAGGFGIGTIILALVAMYFGVDPRLAMEVGKGFQGSPQVESKPVSKNDPQAVFVQRVLASTEDTWGKIFQQSGQRYPAPKLILFRGATPTACGTGQSAMGPFYCPGDKKIYIDLAFYDEMKNRLGASGDFAEAYVIAHEVGHHIQTITGTSEQVQRAKRSARSQAEANRYSVMQELQADCYAGVWAHHDDRANNLLERGDIEEGMRAAEAIGDDALQKKAQGYAVPDSFTHGSSAQRMRWFKQGLQSGNVQQCDTFNARRL